MARRAYRTGLTPAAITDAAVALTAERGLDGWTMRDLTARLDTSLSVIYHHIGDRERVCAAVVDKVYADMRLPLDDTDWRTLLHRVLTAMIDQLADYPGVAAWLLRNGPQTERLVPVLDAGVSRMLDAGWGEEAATAYSIAFNTCLGLIALDDQRARDPDGGGLTGLYRLLETHPEAGPGAERMRRMVAEFAAADDAERARVRREYGRYALERLLDGLELRLHALRASAGMDQPPGDDQRSGAGD
ncbi:TetR/AcrR family transcriptional regulator [Nocardia cyriacigeorgica]|uniref:TetR/AcrR family transcriptional regulator n=1 Tax=Nocardia cyriacigeorgica TaxID=135487 RepID=UPI0013D13013|nr:TetR/AcrR family transcriptional regulator [Nocardia cyriacigeorgica]NEW25950.1 helix-turn-helix transcriptional regulator [Nocardia cyriacigeorgica]